MPRPKLSRRAGPTAAAMFTLYDVWRRLPPAQRRWVMKQARTHGPRLAKQALAARRNRPPR
ncbi:MAG TPA: hypothetical protein VHV52_03960 [Gaiellaceae bacterium]|jgi:hypothetical protein|nr:hypothetical protein [Gaiellaceae bacterium]